MRTVVVYKWARDVGGAGVLGDGTVQWRSTKLAAGADDHAAVAVAARVARESGGELSGLTVGDGDASWALARGVPAAVSVPGVTDGPDQGAVAGVLAAAVRAAGDVDVVVIGDADEHALVAPVLAGHLGWTALAGVTDATVVDGQVEALRVVAGVEETVRVPAPVVLAVAAQRPEERAPGMKELLAARKRPVTTLALDDLDVPAGAGVQELGTRLPDATAARVFDGDPAEAARQLVAALRTEGVL